MKKFKNINNFQLSGSKKGSALAMVLVMVVAVSIILTSLLGYINSQIRYSKDRVERERAFQIAEAGVYYYRWYLAHQVQGRTAQQIADFWETDNLVTGDPMGVYRTYTAEFKDPEGNSIGQYELEVTKPSAGSTIVTAKSTGWTYLKPSAKRVVQVRFRRPSWSEYIFLSDSFMNFGSQARVYGKVHSNYGIRFDGIAYNTVSARPSSFEDPNYGNNGQDFGVYTAGDPDAPSGERSTWPDNTVPINSSVFIGGREFPVPEVNFASADIDNMKTQAQNGNGKYFDSSGAGRKINLKNDGTYDICTVNSANSNTHIISNFVGVVSGASGSYSGTNGNNCTASSCCSYSSCSYIQSSKPERGKCVSLSNYNIIDEGVIFVDNSVWLEGSVNNKRLAVVAGGNVADMYIGISNNNLLYAAHDCNNMLGLIAKQNVQVLSACPSNFTVDAALLAQTGFVGIVGGMGGKNSLTFNGAIASFLEPYFRSGNNGFANRTYNFNNNLLYCPPPYFPTGTEYSIDQWDEL